VDAPQPATASSPGNTALLSAALKELTGAGTQEEVAIATVVAARRMTGADGACVLLHQSDRYLFATAESLTPLYLAPDVSPLYQLAASACLRSHTTVNANLAADAGISLPRGTFIPMASVVSVPLTPQAGCSALGFFWKTRVTLASEQLCSLEALALAAGLAFNARLRSEDAAHARERQRRLITDLQHKVRNILAFVRSIVRRTGEVASSPEDFALHLEARISALARIQGLLAIGGPMGIELEDMIRTEMTANAVRDEQFVVHGPAVRLCAKGAETLALALHELTTNSLKYGALSTPRGHISIAWQTDTAGEPARLRIHWHESGASVAAIAPRRRGFGRELIERMLPYEIDARTRFELTPGGVQCEIDVPLTERTAAGAVPPHGRKEDVRRDYRSAR